MRRANVSRFVAAMSILLILLCLGWAQLVQHLVPTACSYPDPPARAHTCTVDDRQTTARSHERDMLAQRNSSTIRAKNPEDDEFRCGEALNRS